MKYSHHRRVDKFVSIAACDLSEEVDDTKEYTHGETQTLNFLTLKTHRHVLLSPYPLYTLEDIRAVGQALLLLLPLP